MPLTASRIASNLSITPRSARRILHRLEVLGFIAGVGEAQPLGSGRPRRMFHIYSAALDTAFSNSPSIRPTA